MVARSTGHPLVAACAGAKTDSKKNRGKPAVLNSFAFIMFAPQRNQNGALQNYSGLGRCLGTHWAKLRYVQSKATRPPIRSQVAHARRGAEDRDQRGQAGRALHTSGIGATSLAGINCAANPGKHSRIIHLE